MTGAHGSKTLGLARFLGNKGYTGHAGAATPLRRFLPSAFQEAWVPRPGVHLIPVTPPIHPTYWGTAIAVCLPTTGSTNAGVRGAPV
jgi:hypothetical protein